MDQETNLTPTSFIVLGFIELSGTASPYDLKQRLEATVGNFWSVPHSQVYAEPARLAKAGYLTVRQQRGGRRRKEYSLTTKGRKTLQEWRNETPEGLPELRDLSLLKLFFGADPDRLASAQVEAHREKLTTYESLLEADTGRGPRGPWRALEAGIAHEREWIRFWSQWGGDLGRA
jgi:PadR family transcriptional regulator AphA